MRSDERCAPDRALALLCPVRTADWGTASPKARPVDYTPDRLIALTWKPCAGSSPVGHAGFRPGPLLNGNERQGPTNPINGYCRPSRSESSREAVGTYRLLSQGGVACRKLAATVRVPRQLPKGNGTCLAGLQFSSKWPLPQAFSLEPDRGPTAPLQMRSSKPGCDAGRAGRFSFQIQFQQRGASRAMGQR